MRTSSRGRKLVDRALDTDLPAEIFEPVGKGLGEPLRPATGKGPPEDVRRRDQEEADPAAGPRLERKHRVRGRSRARRVSRKGRPRAAGGSGVAGTGRERPARSHSTA